MRPNSQATRNCILAGIGLASLLVYVLACTSFSPDDRQVLYPAFDPQHGGVNAMVYDRKTHKNEPVYVSVTPVIPGKTNSEGGVLRAQWFPDGTRILVAHFDEATDGLVLTVLARGGGEPVRVLRIRESDLGDGTLLEPLPILGSEVFIRLEDRSFVGLNLVTGVRRLGKFTNDFGLYSDPAGQALLAWQQSHGNHTQGTFGRIDPRTLAFQPLMEIPEQPGASDSGAIAFAPGGERLFLLDESGGKSQLELRVFHAGMIELSRSIKTDGRQLRLGPAAALSPKGNCLYTSFMRMDSGDTNCEYGLLEVPLAEVPARWTPLLRAATGDEKDVMLFQGGLSHDGRTWAVASAYLWAQNQSLEKTDSALFLVDLGDPQRKVTRIAIPAPERRKGMLKH